MADFVKVGEATQPAVIYKSESHKLHQAFPVKNGDTIVQGQPVKLNTDGTISPYTGQESEIYLGIATTYSKYPCYPPTDQGIEVTVMMSGFAIVRGIAASAINPGYVNVGEVSGKYQTYANATEGAKTPFIAIQKVPAEDLVYVLVR